jgi:hypothetical protein
MLTNASGSAGARAVTARRVLDKVAASSRHSAKMAKRGGGGDAGGEGGGAAVRARYRSSLIESRVRARMQLMQPNSLLVQVDWISAEVLFALFAIRSGSL